MLPSLDRRTFINSLGGVAAVAAMTHEARADAMEDALAAPMQDTAMHAEPDSMKDVAPPTVAELDAQITTRSYRRGAGGLFVATKPGAKVERLKPLPVKPTIIDFHLNRFGTSQHCLQSANKAMQSGADEEIILACFLHDTVHALVKTDHGWWGAQMYEPYVSEKVSFAIRYHQALRFYEDKEHGYEYPDLYRRMFGSDYKPEPYIEATYQMVRNHKWYLEPRMVTVNDLYAFDPKVNPTLDQFVDIIGRNFKQPKEGLGFDNSPVAHMWRSISRPDAPL